LVDHLLEKARHAVDRAVMLRQALRFLVNRSSHDSMRMAGFAEVARALLDELQLERVDVLGYSWGGALQEFARRAPERVRRLVLCATGPGLGGSPPRPLAALMLATPARYYHPRLLVLTLPHIAGGRTARDPLADDHDPSVPLRNARLLAARLPDARLHVIPGGGHLFLLDDRKAPPKRFVRSSKADPTCRWSNHTNRRRSSRH
jgi:pimeloyl-ACP methyl ester carboxylesterase